MNYQQKILRLFLLFTSYLLFLTSLYAQIDSSKFLNDTTTLEGVTVTAFGSNAKWKDAPAAVALINQQQLQRFDNKTLVPVLNTVAGVRMEERSPGSYRLSIRGSLIRSPFGVRNIRVYWNDIPLTDAGGNTYLNLVDINQLQSIEIIKGPASSMYGANTGGALLLKSNPSSPNPKRSKNNFIAGVETGSYGLLNEQIGWNHHTEKLSFSIQQSHLQNDGYRQQSALRRDNISGNLKWNINAHEQLSALLFYTNLHYETPGGITQQQFDSLPTLARLPTSTLPGAIQQHAGVYNKTGFAGFSLKSVFGNLWSNTTTITVNHTGFSNPFITNYEKRDELNYGARTVFEMNALKFKWLTGAEWQQNISHINNYDNNSGIAGDLMYDDDVHVQQYFLFTQANLQLDKLTVQAGASLNRQQLKYNRISDLVYNFWQHQNTKFLLAPRLSVLYNISSKASVYGVISKGFSPPALAEVRPSTNQFYNLQPEYGWNFEAGIKGSALENVLLFDASVYAFKLKHGIVQQTDSTGADFFVNAGNIKENGAEVWFEARLIRNQNKFIKDFSISNSFAYQPYKFNNYLSGTKNYAGNRLTGVPKYIDVITLDLNTSSGIYFNANANFTSSIPLTDANDIYAGSYKLVQLKLGYKHQFKNTMLDFFAGIDNLLNQKYSLGNDLNAVGGRYFNAAPGRNYFAGVRINF
jgi:iron complex outermembrane receptor protein